MPDPDEYTEFWTAYWTFRLANWLRQIAGTLCCPNGVSDEFPQLANTVVDDHFVEFCHNQFRQMYGNQPSQDVPPYRQSAEKRCLGELNRLRGRLVGELEQPTKSLEAEIVPVLLRVIGRVGHLLPQTTWKTVDDWRCSIQRIPNANPHKSVQVVGELYQALAAAQLLPTPLAAGEEKKGGVLGLLHEHYVAPIIVGIVLLAIVGIAIWKWPWIKVFLG